MEKEREIRKETDFWGNEKEIIYESGKVVGEIKTEERGGLFGFGAESVRVEYDSSGIEKSYTKQEERGGLFGIGTETQEIRYDPNGNEIGHSRVETRGGILGIGQHHVRVEYDNNGAEVNQSNHEKRSGILGNGAERVRVVRYPDVSDHATNSRESVSRSGNNKLYGHIGASASDNSASGSWGIIVLVAVLIGVFFIWIQTSDRTHTLLRGNPLATEVPVPVTAITPIDWRSPPRVSLKGFGPIRVGMSFKEVSTFAGNLLRESMQDEACFVAKPAAALTGISFMFTENRLARIDVDSGTFATLSGARVGQSQEEVLALYRQQLVVELHKYDQNWRYLTFVPKDAIDANFRVVFETNGKTVVNFRSGKTPEVEYVESCS